jgi:hypothetical protein
MTNDPSSSPCYAQGADDVYMGFAARDEIVAALNELLEAERAGARVALASRKSAADARYGELMATVRADEARWCAMLSRRLRRLGATPSRATGAFYAKAMAIDAPLDRLTFLNRGQAWVVRKLEGLIPRVRDEYLHRELNDMLAGHRTNIEAAAAHLRGARGEG